MSVYNIEVTKKVMIYNPTKRDPLIVGEILVDSKYVEKALKSSGMDLWTLEPFEVIDKVGFRKTGDEAAELLLDALAEQVKQDVAAGGQFINLSPAGATSDDK